MTDQADPADLGQTSARSRPAQMLPAASAPADAEFAAFYRESLAALMAFLRYQGASWADATELAQETMIEAFRSWSAIRYPKAWVRTVAGRKLHHRIFSVQERSTETVPEPSP